jgi:soluble lytic murein transglycosylase
MAVADLAHRLAAPRLPERALPQSLRRALYPLPGADRVRKEAAAASVPWSLLAALVRAESRWDEDALSAVGARGLTQMMPATAATVAARHGLEPPDSSDLFRSEVALALGARELGRLAERYRPLLAPAVAAYNAGEAQADLWLSQCGSGCTDARYLLGIGFDATRAYTAAVLAGAEEYAALEPGPAPAVSE